MRRINDLVGYVVCRLICFFVGHLWEPWVFYDGNEAVEVDRCMVCRKRRPRSEGR